MATRKGNGTGNERRLKSGAWAIERMYEGQRLYASGRTKTVAQKAMREQIARMDAGMAPRDSTSTLGAWIQDWRCKGLKARGIKESTRSTYDTLLRCHVVGAAEHEGRSSIDADPIAGVTLDKLKPTHIKEWMLRLEDDGLGAASRRQLYHVMRLALEDAVDDDLIARNPAAKVERPVVEQHEAKYLPPADLVRLLKAASDLRYHEVLVLVAVTGLRRGEALALKWEDIDLLVGVATVRGTLARVGGKLVTTSPKTKKSARKVVLVPAVVEMLARLADQQEREKVHASNLWTDTGFVFTTETGRPVDPRNVFRTMQTAAKRANITGIGVHTLRHSVATGMMDGGENVKVVSGLLGHSSSEITLDVYTHETPDAQRHAVENWAAQIGM